VPAALRRVDKLDLGEVRYSTAPIGTPPRRQSLPIRKGPIAKPVAPPPSQVPIPNDRMDNRLDSVAKGNNEIVPQPPSPPPTQTQAVPQVQDQQQQQMPPAQAPSVRQKK
jgi:hypothetical protein